MNTEAFYKEFDTIIAEVLGYLLNKKDNFIIKNFDTNNACHLFYYEILKMIYSLSNKEIYYKTNWFNFIIKKIFFFKKEKIKKANNSTKGYEIDFKDFYKTLEISEEKMSSIYFTYYHKK